jgi:hypothetical protein
LSGAFAKPKFETPPMVCRACGKTARGPVQPGWIDMDLRDKDTGELESCVAFCRLECMTTWISKETTVIDPTTRELEAVTLAGYAAGDYLDSIGRSDLATLSEPEWMMFLQSIIGTYQEKISGLLDADVPF